MTAKAPTSCSGSASTTPISTSCTRATSATPATTRPPSATTQPPRSVSAHDTAGIWVAFFSECQRYLTYESIVVNRPAARVPELPRLDAPGEDARVRRRQLGARVAAGDTPPLSS